MSKCNHQVFTLKHTVVKGEDTSTNIVILVCDECSAIAAYFDPIEFGEEKLKKEQIQRQYNPSTGYYQNHILKNQIQELLRQKDKMKKDLDACHAIINLNDKKEKEKELNKIKNQYGPNNE
jgi:hypothetical protein